MSKTAEDKQEYYGVQVLRAIAALAVVAGHSTDFLLEKNGWTPRQLGWLHGPAGVDIFFVISGFVMMISSRRLLGKAHPARTFLWRRSLRIVPLYWLLTAVKLALIWAQPSLSQHGRPSAWNSVASFLFIPSVGVTGVIRPVIPVGWTLTFEMVFYLLFAVALTTRRNLLAFLTPAIFALAVAGMFRSNSWPVWTAFVDPIVLEFLAGVAIAEFVRSRRLSKPVLGGALMAAGFVALALFFPRGDQAIVHVMKWGIPAAMIVMGSVLLERKSAAWYPAWLLLLGDASYSIYLVQGFVFPAIHLLFTRGWGASLLHEHALAAGVLMIGLSLVLVSAAGVGVYLGVERRMTEYLRGLGGNRRTVTAG